jgi:hypothetical protein
MAREFRVPESQDFTIIEDGKVLGTVRVKPSAIMWKAKGAHNWKGVTPEKFGQFAESKGKTMKK